jgi:hypothetical protein
MDKLYIYRNKEDYLDSPQTHMYFCRIGAAHSEKKAMDIIVDYEKAGYEGVIGLIVSPDGSRRLVERFL